VVHCFAAVTFTVTLLLTDGDGRILLKSEMVQFIITLIYYIVQNLVQFTCVVKISRDSYLFVLVIYCFVFEVALRGLP